MEMSFALFCDVVIPYRHFLTTYPYHFKGSGNSRRNERKKERRKEGNPTSKDFLALEDGPTGCPKKAVRNCHYLQRNRKSAELNLRLTYNFFFRMYNAKNIRFIFRQSRRLLMEIYVKYLSTLSCV
jgi:hypothetical protein